MARRAPALLALSLLGAGAVGLRQPAARWLLEQGIEAREAGRPAAAIRRLALARALGVDCPRAGLELAEASRGQGDYRALARRLEQLPPQALADTALEARRLGLEAALRFQQGEVEAAHALATESVAAAGDDPARARALIDLGVLLATGLELRDEGERALGGALVAARHAGSPRLEAEAMVRLGELGWRRDGDAERYREQLGQALGICRQAGDRRGEAQVQHRLGLLELAVSDYRASRAALTTATRLYEKHGEQAALADGHLALGALEVAERRSRQGFAHYLRGLEIARRLGYARGAQNAERLLADYALRHGDYAEAIAIGEALLAGPVQPLPSDRRRLHQLVGGAALHQGNSTKALASYQAVLDLTAPGGDDPLLIQTALMMGHAQLERGELVAAERAFVVAAAGADRQRDAGRPDGGQRVWVHLARADLEDRRGRSGAALAELAAAAEIEARSLNTAHTHFQRLQYWQVYRRLQALLFAGEATPLEQAEAARLLFRFVEQMRYRSVRSLLAGGAGSEDHQPGRLTRPVELAAVQERLDPETVLVEYLFAEEEAFALVIGKQRLDWLRLPLSRTAIEAKTRLFAARLRGPGRDRFAPVARDLDAALLEPLRRRGLLAGVRRLGIVPMGFLAELPFAALMRGSPGSPEGRFLVEDQVLFYAPSASVLASRWERPRSVAVLEALALGRGEPRDDLAPLPHAAEEARGIADLLGGEALLDGAAGEAAFKRLAPGARLLHLATHAVSRPESPAATRLELAAGGGEDGALTVGEVLGLSLAADLVTLSGCRTGLSHSLTGNDLAEDDRTGLVEAFLQAGARSVVASLWPVADRPTSELMRTFYQRVLAGAGPAEALATAQRQAIASGDQTAATWAAFVSIGAPGAPREKVWPHR